MSRIPILVLLIVTEVLILTRYPQGPAAGDLSSALLGGTGLFILFGLLCVLGSEKLGAFTGPVMRGGYVSHSTLAGIFVFFGYVLLLLPVILVCYRTLAPGAGAPAASGTP